MYIKLELYGSNRVRSCIIMEVMERSQLYAHCYACKAATIPKPITALGSRIGS